MQHTVNRYWADACRDDARIQQGQLINTQQVSQRRIRR